MAVDRTTPNPVVEPAPAKLTRLRSAAFTHWARTFRLGVKSLWLHRLRSLLTVLGIVFGVCSVIAMLAIGEGASFEAQEQIKSLGSQNIILRSVKPPQEQEVSQQNNQSVLLDYGLTYADIRAIRATIPGVTIVVPGRVLRDFVWNISRRVDCEIVGTVPWYPSMRNHQVARGRFFTDAEMSDRRSVCVLGAEAAEQLFPLEWPIGKTVRVGSKYYRVVGVLEPRNRERENEALGEAGASQVTTRIFVPLETLKASFGEIIYRRRTGTMEMEKVLLHEVTVKVDEAERVVPVSEAVHALIEHKHKKKDYRMIVPLELLKRAAATKRIFNIVLGSIAAISLLVGGIGIMNIMLASVTERTREIGIRRAMGAKRHDIVTQFLIETVLLAATGGIIGVALGIGIPYVISQFAGMRTIVTLWSPVLAFGISALVGVVFGLYPASRAARMDPVEALRHE